MIAITHRGLSRRVGMAELVRAFGVKAQTIRAWVRSGQFPRPMKVRLCTKVFDCWTPEEIERQKAKRGIL